MITFLFNYAHWIIILVAGLVLTKTYKNVKVSIGVVVAALILILMSHTLVFQVKPKAQVNQVRHLPTTPTDVIIEDKSIKPELTMSERAERFNEMIDFRKEVDKILSE